MAAVRLSSRHGRERECEVLQCWRGPVDVYSWCSARTMALESDSVLPIRRNRVLFTLRCISHAHRTPRLACLACTGWRGPTLFARQSRTLLLRRGSQRPRRALCLRPGRACSSPLPRRQQNGRLALQRGGVIMGVNCFFRVLVCYGCTRPCCRADQDETYGVRRMLESDCK